MTPIIRRKIVSRGVLPEKESLPAPEEIFEDEEVKTEPVVSKKRTEIPKLSSSKVKIVTREEDDEEKDVDEQIQQPVIVDKRVKIKKTGTNPVSDIMDYMRSGEAIMVKKEGTSSYTVSIVPNEILISKTGYQYLKKGVTGKQYWNEVLNPAFVEWSRKWTAMTYSEKLDYAKSHNISWDTVEGNERLNLMNLSEAVRKVENIEKYKPEYMKRSARSKIRG